MKFEYIKGIQNTLADTVSRLINIHPYTQLDPDPEDHEFGYYVFNSLLDINILPKKEKAISMLDNNISTQDTNLDIGISTTEIQEIRKKYFYKYINNMLKQNHLQSGHSHFIRDNILM